MKNFLILNALLITTTIVTMEEADTLRKQILSLTNSRIKQHVNQNLLAIVAQTNQANIIRDLKTYYRSGQPKSQTSFWAYVKKPIVNTQKSYAYLQLLRASSAKVRRDAETKNRQNPERLENEPVDSNMWARTKEIWPLVSVQYELAEMYAQLFVIHSWTNTNLTLQGQQEHRESKDVLNKIEKNFITINAAITLCKRTIESE